MTLEEIMAQFQPRLLDNQMQFDAIMGEINHEQTILNHPLIDRKREIVKQRELLNIEKQAINQRLSALSVEYQDIEAKQKEINRKLHGLKHGWIVTNPREMFVRKQGGGEAARDGDMPGCRDDDMPKDVHEEWIGKEKED